MRKVVLFTLQDEKSEVQGPEQIFSTSKVLGSTDRPHSLTCRKSAETKLNNICEGDFKSENEIKAEGNIIITLIICEIVN